MFSISEISQHVINNKPYAYEYCYQGDVQESRPYEILQGATTLEILAQVRSFVKGEISIDDIEKDLDQNSALSYLAAAKLVDMESLEKVNSTYKIRELTLKSEKINLLNAFSQPSFAAEDMNLLLANEFDSSHELAKNEATLQRIYTYCQKEALVIPEMVPIVESVIRNRYETMMKVANMLDKKITVIFKGCSGTGKTYATREYIKKLMGGAPATEQISPEKAVLSNDNIKNDFRGKINATDGQVYLISHAAFRMVSAALRNAHPELSTIQEGWFSLQSAVDTLFKDLKYADLKLEMHDFDGDFEALCLRALARLGDSNSPKLPYDAVARGFKMCRKNRGHLLQQLRMDDSYRFTYVQTDGVVREDIDPLSLINDLDQEIENTKGICITEQHAVLFGDHLRTFIGMTIQEAFEAK